MAEKTCSKCKETKELSAFWKDKSKKDGLRIYCIECRTKEQKDYNKKHYARNKIKRNAQNKEYYIANQSALLEQKKGYRERNKAWIAEKKKEDYRKNKDAMSLKAKLRREKCKDTMYKERYAKQKERMKEDPSFRARINVGKRMNKVIRGKLKPASVSKCIGCTKEELSAHLEAQFQEGMTWENYGLRGWHVDHIMPLSAFDLTDPAQFAKACHYTNLQPLWAFDNISKGGKIPEEFTNG